MVQVHMLADTQMEFTKVSSYYHEGYSYRTGHVVLVLSCGLGKLHPRLLRTEHCRTHSSCSSMYSKIIACHKSSCVLQGMGLVLDAEGMLGSKRSKR